MDCPLDTTNHDPWAIKTAIHSYDFATRSPPA